MRRARVEPNSRQLHRPLRINQSWGVMLVLRNRSTEKARQMWIYILCPVRVTLRYLASHSRIHSRHLLSIIGCDAEFLPFRALLNA